MLYQGSLFLVIVYDTLRSMSQPYHEFRLWLSPVAKQGLETLKDYDDVLPNEIIRRSIALNTVITRNKIDFIRLGRYEHKVDQGYLLPTNPDFEVLVYRSRLALNPIIKMGIYDNFEEYKLKLSPRITSLVKEIDSDISVSFRKSLWNYLVIRQDTARNIDPSFKAFSSESSKEYSFNLPPVSRQKH